MKRQFQLIAQSPISWMMEADLLKRAANVLYGRSALAWDAILAKVAVAGDSSGSAGAASALTPEVADRWEDARLLSIATMLLGLAIENVAKGILIHRDPSLAQADKLGDIEKAHNLIRLVETRCGVAISPLEKDVLKKLTDHVTWIGRYRVPLKAEQMGAYPAYDGSGTVLRGQFSQGDYRTAEAIYRRLFAQLQGVLDLKFTNIRPS